MVKENNILIIEDERKIADTLKAGLIENGYNAEVAYDGNIGYRLYLTHTFNLVLLDINIPEINGYNLCKTIRNKDAHIPIIMLTSLSSMSDKIDGYDAGADDYIVKPFEFKELLLKIGALLKRTYHQAVFTKNILKVADLEINLDTKETTRDGKKINLTAKEFQLLEYLMRNKNRLVSRADIAMNVWGIDFDTNTNVIDVYISYLRNKVDKAFGQKLIQTYIGMGYILKEN